jgi:flagellar basal-body rod protein FlgB
MMYLEQSGASGVPRAGDGIPTLKRGDRLPITATWSRCVRTRRARRPRIADRRQLLAATCLTVGCTRIAGRHCITHLLRLPAQRIPWHTPCSCLLRAIFFTEGYESGMALSLDSYLGVHAQALTLEAQRTEVLAANLANADTPNYKARDIDFKSALAAAGTGAGTGTAAGAGAGTLAMTATQAGHLGASVDPSDAALGNNLKYRVPMAPALDGNTVDSQLEQAAFAENSVRYQATLTFLNARLKELMTAITGS